MTPYRPENQCWEFSECLSFRESPVLQSMLVVDAESTESRRNVQVASTRLGDSF